MPIILTWNLAALPWLGSFGRWMSDFDVAGRMLGRWLDKQLEQAERIDRATSSFPVFRFYNMALCAEITRLQFGSIVASPDSQFSNQMARVGQAWNIPDYVGRRVTEARLIGNTIGVVETLAAAIVDSIDRMATPRPEMFEPDNARFMDLPGLAVLLFNTVGSNRRGIYAAGQGLATGLGIEPQPDASNDSAPTVPETDFATTILAAARDFSARADELLQYVAGALLIVPAVGGLILAMAQDVVLVLRFAVLEFVEDIEHRALVMRRDFLVDFYRQLNAYADGTILFMLAIRDVALDYLRFGAQFGVAYLDAVADGVRSFAVQLEFFWTGVGGLIASVVGYLDRVMAVDIGEVIHNALVLFERIIDFIGDEMWEDSDNAPRYHAPERFAVTIGEFATGAGNGATARTQLADAGSIMARSLRGSHGVSHRVLMGIGSSISGIHLPALAAGVVRVTDILRTPMAAARTQPTLIYSPGTVPDIAGIVIEPLRSGLTTAVSNIGTSLNTEVTGLFTAFGTLADGVATSSANSALAAMRLGSLERFNTIVAGSEAIVTRAFPDMPPPEPTGLEAVAEAYALWLSGAFEMIGSLLGGYLTMMMEQWHNRIDANEDATFEATPTSPRKLLERARLGTVRVPELRIVMTTAQTTSAAANDVADAFQRAVGDAYVAGGRRLDQLRTLSASVAI